MLRRVATMALVFLVGAVIGAVIHDYADTCEQYRYCLEEGWSVCSLEWDNIQDGWSVYFT